LFYKIPTGHTRRDLFFPIALSGRVAAVAGGCGYGYGCDCKQNVCAVCEKIITLLKIKSVFLFCFICMYYLVCRMPLRHYQSVKGLLYRNYKELPYKRKRKRDTTPRKRAGALTTKQHLECCDLLSWLVYPLP
jgi:hypothetical protein